MMRLHNLRPRPGSRHRVKRLGCGESSGHGKTSGKISHSKQEGFARERAHQVTLRHHLHPCAGIGDHAANDVSAKRSGPQHAQRVTSAQFHFCAHAKHSSVWRRLCQTPAAELPHELHLLC